MQWWRLKKTITKKKSTRLLNSWLLRRPTVYGEWKDEPKKVIDREDDVWWPSEKSIHRLSSHPPQNRAWKVASTRRRHHLAAKPQSQSNSNVSIISQMFDRLLMDNGTEYTRAMKNQKRSDSETPSSEWNWMQEEEEVVEGVKYLRAGWWRDGCRYSIFVRKSSMFTRVKATKKGRRGRKRRKAIREGQFYLMEWPWQLANGTLYNRHRLDSTRSSWHCFFLSLCVCVNC